MSFLLETNRLLLREIVATDAPEMFALNADPEVLKHTGDIPFENLDEAKTFLENYSDYRKNGFGRWAVVHKTNLEILGWCGLKKHDNGMVDLGFRLMKKHWQKGYASEAAMASLKYGFEELKLNEIIGRAEPENIASIIVLKKCGMIFSHKEFDDLHHEKEIVIYKITHEDFSRY
jgi:ribosomal-protein-alanine N-acetyltransferase